MRARFLIALGLHPHRWRSAARRLATAHGCRLMLVGIVAGAAASVTLGGVAQQGIGQSPGGLPLSPTIRERGSSVTGAFEGWYYGKDGNTYALVGYFNRNTKQEFDIPVGPNNRIEPDGPDQGQPTHFLPGRQWGVFSVKLPKDLGSKKLTWTIVANGFTNAITLHTQADYIVEPYEDAANKNTPPKLKFEPNGPTFTGAPVGIAAKYNATVGTPLAITVWATDEGPKINIPEPARGRGRGTAASEPGGRAGAAAGAEPAGRGRGFFNPPLAVTWSWMRGPAAPKFDNVKPAIDTNDSGKTTTNVTFSAPGDYILRLEGNDSTGTGGGGFQCCWTNAHIAVTVKAAGTQ
jgi:hypothetical protein